MRVLVVDDNEGVLTVLKGACELKSGIEVDVARSGEEAVSKALQGEYELITLDIEMPGVSGLDILGLLRNLHPHTIIAIITGHVPDDISPDVSWCADVFMSKPIDFIAFHKLLDCSSLMAHTLKEIQQLGGKSFVTS